MDEEVVYEEGNYALVLVEPGGEDEVPRAVVREHVPRRTRFSYGFRADMSSLPPVGLRRFSREEVLALACPTGKHASIDLNDGTRPPFCSVCEKEAVLPKGRAFEVCRHCTHEYEKHAPRTEACPMHSFDVVVVDMPEAVFRMMFVDDGSVEAAYYGDDDATYLLVPDGSNLCLAKAWVDRPATLVHVPRDVWHLMVRTFAWGMHERDAKRKARGVAAE